MSRIKEWLGSDGSFEDADTSDPWFVRHEQIMDVALVLASVAAKQNQRAGRAKASEGAHTDQSQSKNFQQTNQGKINEAKH